MRAGILLILLFALNSCATYYQTNYNFNREFETGDLDKALITLRSQSSEANGKREFLYYVNNGLILSMMGRYEESNEFFEKAYLFGEDYRKNYLLEVSSYLTNPNFTTYKGEDHEHLMLLYYKAINFLKMGKRDEALVECRRLNIRLQQLSDRYNSDRKYRRDAFVHTLMGIIYDVDKDYNNAFIAYKNALEIYQNDYSEMFHLKVPPQLEEDLLRTATLSGMKEELETYKSQFGRSDYQYQPTAGGELIFFWHNGLSPVKAEWGVNFVVRRRNNFLYFSNDQLGLTFPFSLEGYDEKDRQGLSSLEIFRVAFPKYVERPVFYRQASLQTQDAEHPLHLLEDVNQVAFKCLEERMALEFSKALLRAALKKVSEYQLKKEDKTLGSVLGLINALTEKADTRNWQTLPHSIYYSRVPLREGMNEVSLILEGPTKTSQTFQYTAKKGQTLFHTFSSLEVGYSNQSLY